MVAQKENIEVSLEGVKPEDTICMSTYCLGNGVFRDIYDLIYVDPLNFDFSKSTSIVKEIEEFNSKLKEENTPYILIGFGRWGTRDPWLGIPVNWEQISQARVIIETNLKDSTIAPSGGTHFFQKLTSLKVGYMYIKKQSESDFIDWDWLNRQNIQERTEHIVHIKFPQPVVVKIDARHSLAAILKPGNKEYFEYNKIN